VATWSKELKPGFPILRDPMGTTVKAFQIELGVPYNVVLDAGGKVIGTNNGDMDELKKLVAKVAPAPKKKRAAR
jgi:hypothetical protein